MSETLTIDFRDPIYRSNPYPLLAQLRETDPVHQSPLGFWVITRYQDVNALNRDTRLGRDLRQWNGYQLLRPYLADSPLERCVEQWMFSLDGSDHARLRRLVSYAFTPKIIQAMHDEIVKIANELLDVIDTTAPFNFMSAFAQPFPVQVINKILGLSAKDYEQLKAWADTLAPVVEPTISRRKKELANTAAIEMSAYLQDQIAERRRQPGTNLLDRLITVEETGDSLTEPELIANLILLFIAGHETTTNLIGNGLLALLHHPEQMILLREHPEYTPTAVEEFLRYDGPVNINGRSVYTDISVGGKTIHAGDLVLCMLGAANRDPAVFAAPDMLNVTRQPNSHVTFGGGAHYCVGAPLARLEARIAFEQILRRWATIELDEGHVRWRDLINLRGLEQLPLFVKP